MYDDVISALKRLRYKCNIDRIAQLILPAFVKTSWKIKFAYNYARKTFKQSIKGKFSFAAFV